MSRGTDFLGPYRLVKLIRAGQTSQVWEAIKDPSPDRIAVKVLLESHAKNKDEIEQLRHEAEVGKDLDHKYVIKIYEFNPRHGRPFVAMQLFNARNLKQEMREAPDRVAYYAEDIIRRCGKGLKYFNDQGWVHCDVKPDNFLMNEKIDIRLIDFSIASRPRKGGIGGLGGLLGKKSKIRGTRSYMSPEQIRGKAIDQRSDIYSFGCMAYELLAGKPPFSAPTADELLHRHLKTPPQTVQAQNNAVSVEMANLLQDAMAKDPQRRPQTMGEFLDRMKKFRVYRSGMRPPKPKSTEQGS